ncbi:MAG: DUF4982 domain-containing protein [Saprospiraceae bacterium]
MFFKILPFLFLLIYPTLSINAQSRMVQNLDSWLFFKGDPDSAHQVDFDDAHWSKVTIPHDWAIYGPFDKTIDRQIVKIEQNNETIASEKTGRTGALPFIGVGWYRYHLPKTEDYQNKQILLTFDGAMSNAEVFVNGQKVGSRAYGYSYFYFDVTQYLQQGKTNVIAVRLENLSFSSRWYPGAGLYRKVNLIIKDQVSFYHWGHTITTPFISEKLAKVHISSKLHGTNVTVKSIVRNASGSIINTQMSDEKYGDVIEQNIPIVEPILWSPETPYLYSVELQLLQNNVVKDSEVLTFGIREIKYSAEKGFELNGQVTKFKGVCLHHDLGPLGSAINKSALKRQLTILKDMGCNAIRSSHNMPSLEQLALCDEMGFLFLAESFDEWKKPKVENGYNLYFDEWAEKDVINLVHATKNHPCIVMWSAGNEVPDQWGSEGVKRLKWLQDIFHREDPTRPVTVGMDQVKAVMESGFGAILDVPGLNYRVHLYNEAYEKFPQGILLGSETASTVSSRGEYKFPVIRAADKKYDDQQCSSYDLEYCDWSNIPEDDFVVQDDNPWVIGEFVWTGFDYLGEPTPYDNEWPSRSSYFGICDLAGLPKDRYYLYRSRWNNEDKTLHILPHWNWEGREGQTTPIFVYTNYPKAELFINGKSQGIQEKSQKSKLHRYRLMWMDTKYEPGTIKVVAYDQLGNPTAEKTVVTAGKPYKVVLESDKKTLQPDGNDLCFITATIVDKHGNPCPNSSNALQFKVKGEGRFKAVCNGDATSLQVFHEPTMEVFNGKLVIILQTSKTPGTIELSVTGKGLKSEKMSIPTF